MLAFLLLIAEEGYREKIEYLYRTFHTDLLRFAKGRLRQRGDKNCQIDAQDVVQNTFVKITRYAHAVRFEAEVGELRSYLLTVLANEITDFLAEQESTGELVENMAEEEFFDALCIHQRYDEVVQAIRALDERYSTVLFLCYCEECSVKEIAALLGIPQKSVYTRLARGKKRLLEMLSEEGITR